MVKVWRYTTAMAVLGVLIAPGTVLAQSANAAGRSGSSGSSGYDISYPQCGSSYPSGQKFAIVGVNGGLANDANSCLESELSWAGTSPGLSSPAQPGTSLYINTADPGPGTTSQPIDDWPTSGSSSAYGTCAGGWTTSCAYLYGQQRASYSYGLVSAINSGLAGAAPWWLDIETANSWATTGTPNAPMLNIATIQGFVNGLQTAGATEPVGIYSTASQWQTITGLTASTSGPYFAGEPDWVAGGRSLKQATANCSTSFTGGHVALAQYPSGSFDADVACP
jgi:hypothetical protein